MPLPPAMPRWWRARLRLDRHEEAALRRHHADGVAGLQLLVDPVREARRPRTLRTPTRSSPSSTPAQIEYERRRSCAVDVLAQREVLALREAEDLAQLGGHVEGDDHGLVGVGLRRRARAADGR